MPRADCQTAFSIVKVVKKKRQTEMVPNSSMMNGIATMRELDCRDP